MNRRDFMKMSMVGAAIASVGGGMASAVENVERQRPFFNKAGVAARNRNRSTVVCRHGMVCASQPLAAMAGIDALKAGGSCIDAAITTNAALGVVEPASNGIGGDLFAIVWIEKEKKLFGLNASGRSPYDWNLEEAAKLGMKDIPRQSPLSWNVPGCVSGWKMLSDRWGKLGLAKCLEPAIAFARDGFPLSPIIGTAQFASWPSEMAPHMAKVYHPNGTIPRYGDIFQNPLLANNLGAIAKDGPAAFYEGEIAEAIVEEVERPGRQDEFTRPERPYRELGRSGEQQLPRMGRVGNTAKRTRHRRAADSEHAGEFSRSAACSRIQPSTCICLSKRRSWRSRIAAMYYADSGVRGRADEWLISKEYAKQRARNRSIPSAPRRQVTARRSEAGLGHDLPDAPRMAKAT